MRIIFMGTPEFAVPTLEALIKTNHEVCLVVTQPDKQKGRGKKLQFPPVKELALLHSIPVYQPKSMRSAEAVSTLVSYNADVIVVVAFGQILTQEVLDITPYGCINVHSSLLPAYRGAAPIQWTILAGETKTGVTTMQLDAGIDTGDILLQEEVEIQDQNAGELQLILAKMGADLCVKTLTLLQSGSITPIKQGQTTTVYAGMLKKEMGEINWNKSSYEIYNQVRAFNPWPGSYTFYDGILLKIWKTQIVTEEEYFSILSSTQNEGIELDRVSPGTIVLIQKNRIIVKTGDGFLGVKEVQMSGKKRLPTAVFLLGHTIQAGDSLG